MKIIQNIARGNAKSNIICICDYNETAIFTLIPIWHCWDKKPLNYNLQQGFRP